VSDAILSPSPVRRPLILAAENDPSHRFVTRRLFAAVGVEADLHFVSNGRELLDYLERCKAEPSDAHPWPHFVLLDLHMPEMGGIEALKAMRADGSLRVLPVIVFSSSDQPRHVDQAYASGANAYLVKAGNFRELVRHLRGMSTFWLEAARLPRVPGPSRRAPDKTS
jgi:two-component system, response regulator